MASPLTHHCAAQRDRDRHHHRGAILLPAVAVAGRRASRLGRATIPGLAPPTGLRFGHSSAPTHTKCSTKPGHFAPPPSPPYFNQRGLLEYGMIGVVAPRSGLARLITAIGAAPVGQALVLRGSSVRGISISAARWAGLLGWPRQLHLHAAGSAMAGWRPPVSAGRSAAAASPLHPRAPAPTRSVELHPSIYGAPSRFRSTSTPAAGTLPGLPGWPAGPSAGLRVWPPPRAGFFVDPGDLAQAAAGLRLLLPGRVQTRGGRLTDLPPPPPPPLRARPPSRDYPDPLSLAAPLRPECIVSLPVHGGGQPVATAWHSRK